MGERNVTCSVEVVGSTPTASTNQRTCIGQSRRQRNIMRELHLTIKSSSRIKEVYLNGMRKAAVYEKKDGGIDKVFLYRDKEEKGNRSYTNMLDVITDMLPSEWKKKQTFSVDANIVENLRLYR